MTDDRGKRRNEIAAHAVIAWTKSLGDYAARFAKQRRDERGARLWGPEVTFGELRHLAENVEWTQLAYIRMYRASGYTWAKIADAMELASPQAAQQWAARVERRLVERTGAEPDWAHGLLDA